MLEKNNVAQKGEKSYKIAKAIDKTHPLARLFNLTLHACPR